MGEVLKTKPMIRVLWRFIVLFFACCSSSSEDTQSTLLISELISPIEITLGGEMTDAQKEFFEPLGNSGGYHAEIDSEFGFSSMKLGSWVNMIRRVSFSGSIGFESDEMRCKTNELISLLDYFYGPSELVDLPPKADPEKVVGHGVSVKRKDMKLREWRPEADIVVDLYYFPPESAHLFRDEIEGEATVPIRLSFSQTLRPTVSRAR